MYRLRHKTIEGRIEKDNDSSNMNNFKNEMQDYIASIIDEF